MFQTGTIMLCLEHFDLPYSMSCILFWWCVTGTKSLSFALLFFYFINVLCAEKPSAGADNRCYLCTWKDNSISQFIIQLAFTRCSTFVPVLPHKVNLLLLANHTYYSRNLYLIINFWVNRIWSVINFTWLYICSIHSLTHLTFRQLSLHFLNSRQCLF